MKSYSKGAQGLSVQLQKFRIFTENSISLSQYWRQRGSRYAIHAGRNLLDKEFRYLRTVRVTAAVYWDFHSKLTLVLLIFQHRAGVRPNTSFYNLAESCVFNKQSLPPLMCHFFRLTKKNTPFPEVTESICRVPSILLSQRLNILYPSTCGGFSTVL